MKPLKEKISITVDSDVLEIIRQKADEDDRSLSQYINLILKQHLNNIENWKNAQFSHKKWGQISSLFIFFANMKNGIDKSVYWW